MFIFTNENEQRFFAGLGEIIGFGALVQFVANMFGIEIAIINNMTIGIVCAYAIAYLVAGIIERFIEK
jgi:hypothetical protein